MDSLSPYCTLAGTSQVDLKRTEIQKVRQLRQVKGQQQQGKNDKKKLVLLSDEEKVDKGESVEGAGTFELPTGKRGGNRGGGIQGGWYSDGGNS